MSETIKPIVDRNRMREIVLTAKKCREIVEVRIANQTERYFSYFTDPPANEQVAGLCIVPLEPAVGNGRMRVNPAVSIGFNQNTMHYSATTHYKRTIILPVANVVELVLPERFDVAVLRRSSRISLPDDLDMMVEVMYRNKVVYTGPVVDFSEGGMLYEGQMQRDALPKKGDLQEVVILPPSSIALEPVNILIEVARIVEVRRKIGTGTRFMVGVRFLKFAPEVERLANALRKMYGIANPKSKPGWFG